MDSKIKKCCPNCCQLYQLKSLSPKGYGNIPLFLKCGHSMCENCVSNIVKFAEPIECKVCHQDMILTPEDQVLLMENSIKLYDLFPINVYMLGELAQQHIEQKFQSYSTDVPCFIDLDTIIKSTETTEGKCLECHATTSKMCQQCSTIMCVSCFNKSHKNFVIFQNHVLENIGFKIKPSTCKIHKEKPLDYYCKSCVKSICMDCFMVGGEKSCKSHDVVSVNEVNESFLSELSEITPKIDELYRRLTKTAVDIGNILLNFQNDAAPSDVTKMINNVEQQYSKIFAQIQSQKDEIIQTLMKAKLSEKESLLKARSDIENSIKKSKTFLNVITSLDGSQLKEANISAILKDAKELLELPWYLKINDEREPLKITVNEELSDKVKDYVHLAGNGNFEFKLCSTSEIENAKIEIPAAPSSVVYPPQLVQDVRQSNKPNNKDKEPMKTPTLYKKAPKYRAKSGSCSSINSMNSDASYPSSYDQYTKPVVQPVMPFPESQYPKLQEGSQELIYISHIVDPHNFFVQRACHQSRVEELLREFRNAISLPTPSAHHVTEGKVYLVHNEVDNLWMRCRIVSIDRRNANKPKFHVFCIDFGGTEVVTIDKLRLLPPARLHSPPPFAINCALANCQPKNGTWTSDDAILIQHIIDNKQAVIHVHRIRSMSANSVTLEVDVTTFEHGLSVAHALHFHGRAYLPDRMPYPKAIGVIEKPRIFISNNDFKLNSVEEVYITHVVSPDHFFVRMRHLQSVYEKLCEDLDRDYNANIQTRSIYLPEKGMVCVVNVERCGSGGSGGSGGAGGAGRWARAQVAELPGRGRVRVALLDTGAALLAHWTALRRIAPHYTTLRALATECHLAGVTPTNKQWNTASVALLKKFEGRVLDLHVEDQRNRNSLGVTLYDKTDEDNIMCVNELMIKHKFAVTFGVFMFNKNFHNETQVNTQKSPIKEKRQPEENIKAILKRTTPTDPKKQQSIKGLEAKDKGPLRLEVKVLNYQSPSLLYVSLVQQQKAYNELFEKIQKYYTKKNEKSTQNWNVGDKCCTICIQSKTWRRAVILEIADDNAKVFYSDFACVETVPLQSLRELTQEFMSVGGGAIMCHLYGVMPAVGEEWPSLTKEYLKELLDAYQRIFITKTGNFMGKSMPVELWVYHTIQGGALEPNISEWRCLNKKIIEQGLGIPDKSEELLLVDESTDQRDDTLSFLNDTGSVKDFLQLDPITSKSPNKSFSSGANSPIQDEEEDQSNEEKPDASNTVFISDWLPPEPLQNKEFTAMPTYIDIDGVVYLHDVTQQDTLDLIRKALDVRFKNPDPKAKYTKWTVGEPCIALFYLDNRFYRGKVLEVNNETSSCLIHYVDYGNEELCSFENLRKSVALYQIPIQAHKCILDRIKPVDKKWNRQTLDYIHKSIVEKQCFVKITGEPIGGLIPIDLKFDKLWINDHLVEFEMAEYTDGSKAVVRKFVPNIQQQERCEKVINESDSGPDYIIEADDNKSMESIRSMPLEDFAQKDWNQLMEEEENDSPTGEFVAFPMNTETEFVCNITFVKDVNKLELSIVFDEAKTSLYDKMFKELQEDCVEMNALNGIFENKPCVAIFPEDGLWYRAIILRYSEIKGLIKVKYVDYGNEDVVSLADVREITEKYLELPPATISAQIYGIVVNPDINVKDVGKVYQVLFVESGPFQTRIVDYENDVPCVELRNNEDQLVYEGLFEKKIFLKA
ncbi:RING finger protein 17 [Colias croceus]|uniref:RING finger protein 17 n=1 Tax=Colias crocea TaxID=72248 RepID=UPI001E27DE99|nr:RING finger protein 17 [Colias croceus]